MMSLLQNKIGNSESQEHFRVFRDMITPRAEEFGNNDRKEEVIWGSHHSRLTVLEFYFLRATPIFH